jgi:hypothetical protein
MPEATGQLIAQFIERMECLPVAKAPDGEVRSNVDSRRGQAASDITYCVAATGDVGASSKEMPPSLHVATRDIFDMKPTPDLTGVQAHRTEGKRKVAYGAVLASECFDSGI